MPTERDKMLAGEPYDAQDPDLVAARLRTRTLLQRLNGAPPGDLQERALLRELFGAGGDSVTVTPPFHCDYGAQIELGENVYFNFNCVLLDVCPIRIGAHTLVGPAVQIYTPLHPM